MGYLLPVLSLILLSAVASHATLPAKVYWHTVLPNTPMPSAIQDLLKPVDENAGATVNVGLSTCFIYIYQHTCPPPLVETHDHPQMTFFFLKKDLHVGAKMNLNFTSTGSAAAFLSKREADSIPFSSEKVQEAINRFSIEAGSPEADAMKETVKLCEAPGADGEQRVCATSLESMVDFSTASLKTHNLIAASTTFGKEAEKEQRYTMAGVRKMPGSELVACHPEPYAYAVLYCHKTEKTSAYNVDLVGENGAKVEAVAVCHADTAGWNPEHVAFKVLNVKPGTVPVCHFVLQDHVVWTRRN